MGAFPSFDRYDDQDDDDEGEDYEAHESYAQEDHCCEEGGGQDGDEGSRKEERACHEEEGIGIFAPKVLSPALATICGGKKMPRTEVTKKIWVYIKKNSLNQGRTIKPDSTLKAIFPVASIDMLKMAGYVSKHLS